jgi:5,10-methylenetetrahydromethanopterin reductase
LTYHVAYEFGGAQAVLALPGGEHWLAVVDRAPAGEQHLVVHSGHCVELNEADRAAWDAGGHSILTEVTISGTRDQVRHKLDDLAARGVTEIAFQPCGPDITTELEHFLDTARSRSQPA